MPNLQKHSSEIIAAVISALITFTVIQSFSRNDGLIEHRMKAVEIQLAKLVDQLQRNTESYSTKAEFQELNKFVKLEISKMDSEVDKLKHRVTIVEQRSVQ